MKYHIKEIVAVFLTILVILFPILISKEIMYDSYTETNNIVSTAGIILMGIWFTLVICGVYSFMLSIINYIIKNDNERTI